MTNATLPLPAAKPAQRGFPGIRCPMCGTADDAQSLDLDDLNTFRCGGCDEQYTTDDIRQLVTAWQRVLTWIEAAPSMEE